LNNAVLTIMTAPEPSVLTLTGLGLGGAMLFLRRRAQRANQ
jgi:hypothetical protein